ncbi:MAG TPA: type II secretion system F family protein [Lachnospiraceae bacterium]|nr:type II secretion system F family protein [Lachnospiraceae bacterium]
MAKYDYRGLDASGKVKKGTIEANNEETAKTRLRAEGINITEFGESKDIELGGIFKKKVKNKDLSVFCKQFAAVLRAGVPVIAALDMLATSTENKRLRESIEQASTHVQKGGTLADALKLNSDVFPNMLSNMVAAGESSGKMEICFERMAHQFEKDGHIEGKIKSAMMYPIVILVVVIGVVILMLTMVIPTFSEMFKEMGAELPKATQMLVNASDFLVARWYIVLIAVVLIIVAIKVFSSTEYGQEFNGNMALKMPIFGNLNVKTAAATFSRTFATLLASGISMIDAIEQTANVMKNKVIRDKLKECKVQVSRGVPLSKPIKDMDIFPIMMPQMMHIGEETGNIEDMMEKVADFYEDEVDLATDALTSAMEPLIIVVMAVVVGGMVVAIYSPILNMYDAVDSY